MKQIPSPIYPQSINVAPSFKFLPYLRLALILLSGLALTNLGMRAFAQSTQFSAPPPNPFLEYADIFPGQPISAVEARTFSCWSNHNYYDSLERACSSELTSGVFATVDMLTSDDTIREITFTLRENIFNVGNLVLLFGNPNFRAYPHKVFFFWNNLFVIVSTSVTGNPAAIRPVWSVTFADTY